MKGFCEGIEGDLPLYVEGELDDPVKAALIGRHLERCEECRGWVESYQAFTADVVESCREEAPPASLRFTERVMAAVREVEGARRRERRRALAAAVLLLAGLAAGGLLWLEGRSREPHGGPAAVASSAAAPRPLQDRPAPDLKTALWVIGPEREVSDVPLREVEAMLYGLVLREAAAESRAYFMLQALLAAEARPAPRATGYRLVLVPEEGRPGSPLVLRPVALPVPIAERDLSAGARVRLQEPRRRYRIFWQEGPGASGTLQPVGLPFPRPEEARGLPFDTPEGLEFLPLLPERY